MVSADAPALTVKFGAFDVVPPVVPNTTVAVAAMFLVNPPVPVQVKPVAVAIDRTVVAAVVLVNAIFADPKVIARVLVLLELKEPVLNVLPFKSRVPCVRVNVLAVPKAVGPISVTVMPEPLTVTLPRAFTVPVILIVPDAKNVGTKAMEFRRSTIVLSKLPHALYVHVPMLKVPVPVPKVKFLI